MKEFVYCSNGECPHREKCVRAIYPAGDKELMRFKVRDGKCKWFVSKGDDLSDYYNIIPPPLINELTVVTESDDLPVSVCFGCFDVVDKYAQCTTVSNWINICEGCIEVLDQVSFRSRVLNPGSIKKTG